MTDKVMLLGLDPADGADRTVLKFMGQWLDLRNQWEANIPEEAVVDPDAIALVVEIGDQRYGVTHRNLDKAYQNATFKEDPFMPEITFECQPLEPEKKQ